MYFKKLEKKINHLYIFFLIECGIYSGFTNFQITFTKRPRLRTGIRRSNNWSNPRHILSGFGVMTSIMQIFYLIGKTTKKSSLSDGKKIDTFITAKQIYRKRIKCLLINPFSPGSENTFNIDIRTCEHVCCTLFLFYARIASR